MVIIIGLQNLYYIDAVEGEGKANDRIHTVLEQMALQVVDPVID